MPHFFQKSDSEVLCMAMCDATRKAYDFVKGKTVQLITNKTSRNILENSVYGFIGFNFTNQAIFAFENDLYGRLIFAGVGVGATAIQAFSKKGYEKIEGKDFKDRAINAAKHPNKHTQAFYFSVSSIPFLGNVVESITKMAEFPMAAMSNMALLIPYIASSDHFLNNRDFQAKTKFQNAKSEIIGATKGIINSLEFKTALFFVAYGFLHKEGADIVNNAATLDIKTSGQALLWASKAGFIQSAGLYLVNKGKQLENIFKKNGQEMAK